MNKKELFKKYEVIWILIGIIIIMGFLKIKYGYREQENEKQILSEPTLSPVETVTENDTVTKVQPEYKDYPLWKLLPYQGDGFVVERYIAPKTLSVTIMGDDGKETIIAITLWLEGLGEAGKGHKIEVQN